MRTFVTMSSSPHPSRGGCFPRRGASYGARRRCATTGTTRLKLLPDLHFELIGVYQGESLLVINYRNERGGLVNEVLMFDGDLVREGHGTYL